MAHWGSYCLSNSLFWPRIRWAFVLLCCHVVTEKALSSHVLGIGNLNYVSHNRILWKIGKELQRRGHRYTQLLPTCAKEKYTDVDIKVFNTSITNEVIEDVHVMLMKMDDINSLFGGLKLFRAFQGQIKDVLTTFCDDLFANDYMSEIKQSVDLILCDVTNFCCPFVAGVLNITRVAVSPVGFMGALGSALYNTPIAYLPLESTPDSPQAFSFTNRIKGFMTFIVSLAVTSTMSKMISPKSWERYASKELKDSDVEKMIEPCGIFLIPHDFAVEYPRPLSPNFKVIGPVLPDVPDKLPDDLERFMTDSKEMVIVSFGTTFSRYRPEFIETLADALGKLPFNVLWKHGGKTPQNLSPNIKVVSWFPQNDLLGHPSTKVFLTHGGLNSFLESVYHAVPMVVIPLFGDQHRQAMLVRVKELGVSLDKNAVTSEDIARSVVTVATSKQYKANVHFISGLIRDRQVTPVQEAAYWIEHALKHDGARHLKSSAYDMPFYQFYMLDVFLFIFVVILVVIYAILRLCYFIICQGKSRTPDKEKKT